MSLEFFKSSPSSLNNNKDWEEKINFIKKIRLEFCSANMMMANPENNGLLNPEYFDEIIKKPLKWTTEKDNLLLSMVKIHGISQLKNIQINHFPKIKTYELRIRIMQLLNFKTLVDVSDVLLPESVSQVIKLE